MVRMKGFELLLCTEKSTSECCYYTGTYSDLKIFALILRMLYSELRGFFKLHLIWVAGTRQIATGIDDFSRGDLTGQVMNGVSL